MKEKQEFDLGKRTEELICATGLNPYAFCKKKGIPQSLISKWINRNPDPKLSSIRKVCEALGIRVGQFVDPEEGNQKSAIMYALTFWWDFLTLQEQMIMLKAIIGVAEHEGYSKEMFPKDLIIG